MKGTKLMGFAGVASLALTAAAVNVTIDKVQQRYPWNGLVDIDYTLDGGITFGAKFDVTVTAEGKIYSAKTFLQDFNYRKGSHRLTWDSAADNAKFFSKDATVNMSLISATGDFVVFDLDTGAYAKETGVNVEKYNTDEYKTNKLVMRVIPAGTFTEYYGQRTPRQVTVTQPFLIGIFEVTQTQYAKITDQWPSYWTTEQYKATRPVETVSFLAIRGTPAVEGEEDVIAEGTFLAKLREKTKVDFDLPTVAQWQYAAGVGVGYARTFAPGYDAQVANGNRRSQIVGVDEVATTPVGCFAANENGLYDVLGNVFEWTRDFAQAWSSQEAVTDPINLSSTGARWVCGGAWNDNIDLTWYWSEPVNGTRQVGNLGFRLVAPVVE